MTSPASCLTLVITDITCEQCGHTSTHDRLGFSSSGHPAELTSQEYATLQSNGFTITHLFHTSRTQPFCHRCFDTSHLISINDIQSTVVRAPPPSERAPLRSYSLRKASQPVKSTRSVLYDD